MNEAVPKGQPFSLEFPHAFRVPRRSLGEGGLGL